MGQVITLSFILSWRKMLPRLTTCYSKHMVTQNCHIHMYFSGIADFVKEERHLRMMPGWTSFPPHVPMKTLTGSINFWNKIAKLWFRCWQV